MTDTKVEAGLRRSLQRSLVRIRNLEGAVRDLKREIDALDARMGPFGVFPKVLQDG